MKNIIYIITFAVEMVLIAIPANAQHKVTIDDRAGFLNDLIENELSEKLAADSMELTSVIDNRNRCDYWFVTMVKEGNDLKLSITDCNDNIAGSKNLGSMISASDPEKAFLLYYSISEIMRNPDSGKVTVSNRSADTTDKKNQTSDPSHHASRYFFAPSSYTLKKGELYYNSLYFLLHDVQYGVSDQFSIGMGTSIFGFPFYITPKISVPINTKSAFAIGDMLILGTYGARFTGNLLYITYTRGGYLNNFTVGGGVLYIGGGDVENDIEAAVVNFSGLARISDHIFFITENYMSPINKMRGYAFYSNYQTQQYHSATFDQKAFFIYGLTGFRFINRMKDLKSWQFGLSYFYSMYSDVPDNYKGPYWYNEKQEGGRLIVIPVVGYARKFSPR